MKKRLSRNAEMSEWFKEHDWKSCVGLKPTGGSNPLLCANVKHTHSGVFFRCVVKGLRKLRINGGSREENESID